MWLIARTKSVKGYKGHGEGCGRRGREMGKIRSRDLEAQSSRAEQKKQVRESACGWRGAGEAKICCS